MEGGRGSVKRSVEDVFIDFKRRRAALIKALTTDVEDFYNQCDPDKDNLCLYGFPSGQWEVNLPPEDVPPEIPEPTLGINFARDGMVERDWLSLVAVHSDAWLASLSSYYAARFGFDSNHRKRLFNLMYELPTIFEVVTGTAKMQVEERSAVINNSSRKSKSAGKSLKSDCHSKMAKSLQEEEEQEEEEEEKEEEEDEDEDKDEDEDEDGETHCGSCGGVYTTESSDFWIGCDLCGNWFHGKCVKITPARAKHIKHYKCRSCSNKRPRI